MIKNHHKITLFILSVCIITISIFGILIVVFLKDFRYTRGDLTYKQINKTETADLTEWIYSTSVWASVHLLMNVYLYVFFTGTGTFICAFLNTFGLAALWEYAEKLLLWGLWLINKPKFLVDLMGYGESFFNSTLSDLTQCITACIGLTIIWEFSTPMGFLCENFKKKRFIWKIVRFCIVWVSLLCWFLSEIYISKFPIGLYMSLFVQFGVLCILYLEDTPEFEMWITYQYIFLGVLNIFVVFSSFGLTVSGFISSNISWAILIVIVIVLNIVIKL